jgi:hypothetical protein
MCRARLRWQGDRYRYEPEQGDLLGYAPVFEALRRTGRIVDGWARDADLFPATWRHAYPDALARVRHGLEDLVRVPATVLFSMQDGATYGPTLTHLGAELLGGQIGTHGSLSATESLGFAACSVELGEVWPAGPALRPEHVFAPWSELLRAGAGSR